MWRGGDVGEVGDVGEGDKWGGGEVGRTEIRREQAAWEEWGWWQADGDEGRAGLEQGLRARWGTEEDSSRSLGGEWKEDLRIWWVGGVLGLEKRGWMGFDVARVCGGWGVDPS